MMSLATYTALSSLKTFLQMTSSARNIALTHPATDLLVITVKALLKLKMSLKRLKAMSSNTQMA